MEQHPSVIAYIRALQTGRLVEGGLEKKSQIVMAYGKANRGGTKERFLSGLGFVCWVFYFPQQQLGSSTQMHKGTSGKAVKLWNVLPQDVVDTKL